LINSLFGTKVSSDDKKPANLEQDYAKENSYGGSAKEKCYCGSGKRFENCHGLNRNIEIANFKKDVPSEEINRELIKSIYQIGDDDKNARVWIFVEPSEAALEAVWDKANIIPPKTLIQEADDFLNLEGFLTGIVPDNFSFDKMPRMTGSQRRSLLDELADGRRWMRYSGNTDMATYNVVVMVP